MFGWITRGLRTGILTTRYPRERDSMPAAYRGAVRVSGERCRPETAAPCVAVCQPHALSLEEGALRVDLGRCITCGLCVAACPFEALIMTPEFELSARTREDLVTEVRSHA
jgi:formate hydrogenlyase subunit 6/NADH:ubiquinone oxidoreductase subunit I